MDGHELVVKYDDVRMDVGDGDDVVDPLERRSSGNSVGKREDPESIRSTQQVLVLHS